MSRVVTFSRQYPRYHPKAGQRTNFVEKILKGLPADVRTKASWDFGLECVRYIAANGLDPNLALSGLFLEDVESQKPKVHAIRDRSKRRWKVGEKFTPRIWGTDVNPKSGKSGAYQSKQLTFAPELEILKVWDFDCDRLGFYSINGLRIYSPLAIARLAENDGLTAEDMQSWLMPTDTRREPFTGQILCWSKEVDYEDIEFHAIP